MYMWSVMEHSQADSTSLCSKTFTDIFPSSSNVSEATQSSLCFWNSWEGFDTVLELIKSYIAECLLCLVWVQVAVKSKLGGELYLLSSDIVSSKCYPYKRKHTGFVVPSNTVSWWMLWVRPVSTTTGTFPSYNLTGVIFSTSVFFVVVLGFFSFFRFLEIPLRLFVFYILALCLQESRQWWRLLVVMLSCTMRRRDNFHSCHSLSQQLKFQPVFIYSWPCSWYRWKRLTVIKNGLKCI